MFKTLDDRSGGYRGTLDQSSDMDEALRSVVLPFCGKKPVTVPCLG